MSSPAFRDTGTFARNKGAVAAWLRKTELEAAQINTAPFDQTKLKEALPVIRDLTQISNPHDFIPKLQEICGACGVAVVFVPALKGCPVSGATRWLTPQKALLALSLRYKTNDHLWFALFHELGHLILHGKKLLVLEGIEGLDAKQEDEANHFAANQLIPQTEEYTTFKSGNLTQGAVQAFAAKLGISPGIVVGRLQNDGRIPWQSNLNNLKVHYNWVKKEE